MDLRESLKRRADVPDHDVEAVIERAARLQERDEERASRPTVAELEAVAAELDIAPHYVEAAITELRGERETAERDAAVAAREQASRRQAARMLLVRIVFAAGVLGLLTVGAAGLLGISGASALSSRAAELSAAEARLEAVIDRQAALAPTLVGLAGGEVADITDARRALDAATTVPERLAASRRLDEALAAALAALPPAADPAAAQQRLDLQHELVGAQNRIGVERARYDEAIAAWEQAVASPGGRLALGLGLRP